LCFWGETGTNTPKRKKVGCQLLKNPTPPQNPARFFLKLTPETRGKPKKRVAMSKTGPQKQKKGKKHNTNVTPPGQHKTFPPPSWGEKKKTRKKERGGPPNTPINEFVPATKNKNKKKKHTRLIVWGFVGTK